MFLLVICKTLGLFVNTLTNIFFATGRIYGRNKFFFCEFVPTFLNSTSNFEHFEEEDYLQGLRTFEKRDCEKRG